MPGLTSMQLTCKNKCSGLALRLSKLATEYCHGEGTEALMTGAQ